MSTVINGSSPSITFSDGTTQTTSAFGTGSNLYTTGTNIGIGTNSPSNKLTIQADATGASFADNGIAQLLVEGLTDYTKRIGVGIDTTNNVGVIQAQKYGTGTYPLALNPAGGNVGIGTNSPASLVTIIPSTTPTTVATATQLAIGESTNNGGYRLLLGYANLSSYTGVIQANGGGSGTPLALNPSGGNVGIGTSSPTDKLHVYNTAYADCMLIESTQIFSTLAFKCSTNSNTAVFGVNGVGDAYIENKKSSGNISFTTNGNVAMTIDQNQSVNVANGGSRASGADTSSYPRLIAGASGGTSGSSSGGFGEFFYANPSGGSCSFKIVNGTCYLIAIWSSSGSASANPVLYLCFGLNKGGGSNPLFQKIGGAAETWSFSYALTGSYDTIVTVTDGGYNQGTRVVIMQLGSQ